jgi:hypothetical protein
MKLLQVLENRNRCLKKISEVSENFLFRLISNGTDESGELSGLNSFEIWRTSAFKTLALYDKYINSLAIKITPEEKNEVFKVRLRNILEISKNIIYYIKDIDMKITNRISEEKSRLSKTLAAAEQSKKTFTKFRSEVPSKSGGQLDGKI